MIKNGIYVNPMDDVREGSEDIHARAYVAYGKTADHKLYLESTYTTQIDQADIEYAFKRGMLMIFDGTNYMRPVSMTNNTIATVDMVSDAVALVDWYAKAAL